MRSSDAVGVNVSSLQPGGVGLRADQPTGIFPSPSERDEQDARGDRDGGSLGVLERARPKGLTDVDVATISEAARNLRNAEAKEAAERDPTAQPGEV